jgi:hypothetical protein
MVEGHQYSLICFPRNWAGGGSPCMPNRATKRRGIEPLRPTRALQERRRMLLCEAPLLRELQLLLIQEIDIVSDLPPQDLLAEFLGYIFHNLNLI